MSTKNKTGTDLVIWESNTLALAPTNKILHPNALRLFMFAVAHLPKIASTNSVSFQMKDFATFFGVDVDNSYKFADKWSNEIMSYLYYVKKNPDDDKFTKVSAIPKMDYDKGTVTAEFHQDVLPHLLNLDRDKISIGLNLLKEFKNSRFLRLYEYLKAKVYVGHTRDVILSLEQLYTIFAVKNSAYKNFSDFNRRVLRLVLADLNETELIVKITNIKTGRKITGIKFTVTNPSPGKASLIVDSTINPASNSTVRNNVNNIKLNITTDTKQQLVKLNDINQNQKIAYCQSHPNNLLIPRTGKYGFFWFCPEPDCDYTISQSDFEALQNQIKLDLFDDQEVETLKTQSVANDSEQQELSSELKESFDQLLKLWK